MLITAPTVISRMHGQNISASTESLAPGLAALTDSQLAELLPRPGDFPASWRVKPETSGDMFGYVKEQTFSNTYTRPPECANLNEYAIGYVGGAEVSGRDPAAPPGYASDPKDLRLQLGREFDRSGFDSVISLASRCARSTLGGTLVKTVRILEDSRPAGSTHRFRLAVTEIGSGIPTQTEYLSFARTAELILTGWASTGHEQTLNTLFDDTMRRIHAG